MALFALVRRLKLKRQHASRAAGFAAVTIAGAVLIGWWGGLPMLSSCDEIPQRLKGGRP
jgi:hypothetical protein